MEGMEISKNVNPWRFFALAFGISWFFWSLVILLRWNVWSFPAVIFGGLGLFGPALAEIILISRTHNKAQWKDYWQRVFDIRRIRPGWQLVIWLTFPAIHALAISLSVLWGGALPEFETATKLGTEYWRIVPFLLFILLFGPLPEELGWRGYALDGLQARFNSLLASLILGGMWALWHLPLFFMQGTFQHDQLGMGNPGFWTYLLGPVIISILFTWIYNNTHRSTLSAILFHFMINLTAELLPLTEQQRVFSLVIIVVLTLGVVILWGPDTLTRQPKREDVQCLSPIGKEF